MYIFECLQKRCKHFWGLQEDNVVLKLSVKWLYNYGGCQIQNDTIIVSDYVKMKIILRNFQILFNKLNSIHIYTNSIQISSFKKNERISLHEIKFNVYLLVTSISCTTKWSGIINIFCITTLVPCWIGVGWAFLVIPTTYFQFINQILTTTFSLESIIQFVFKMKTKQIIQTNSKILKTACHP